VYPRGSLIKPTLLWKYYGQERPAFADTPAAGQESVWDYPRPPIIASDRRLIQVRCNELLVAETTCALRVLETASAPGFYIAPTDVRLDLLKQSSGESHCEWKGAASYFDLYTSKENIHGVGWSYPHPRPAFSAIAGYISFYPAKIECYVNGERVQSQAGGFYGGWVTSDIAGPIKGPPGTQSW
jgi:uncharacterized protein (DUF427 family)